MAAPKAAGAPRPDAPPREAFTPTAKATNTTTAVAPASQATAAQPSARSEERR
jgi:hypothetical protein